MPNEERGICYGFKSKDNKASIKPIDTEKPVHIQPVPAEVKTEEVVKAVITQDVSNKIVEDSRTNSINGVSSFCLQKQDCKDSQYV